MRNYPHYLTTGGGPAPAKPARRAQRHLPRMTWPARLPRSASLHVRPSAQLADDVDTRFCAALMMLMLVVLALGTLLGQTLRAHATADVHVHAPAHSQQPAAYSVQTPIIGPSGSARTVASPRAPSVRSRRVRHTTSTQTARLLGRTVPGLVDITTSLPDGSGEAGTGIVLRPDGLVLTNDHVISHAVQLTALDLGNGHRYWATVLGADPDHDIALIQLHHASQLHTAHFADSDTARLGDPVGAIGNAYGLDTPRVGTGPITALRASIASTTSANRPLTGLIEARDSLTPGQSGGPMVDQRGDILGVNVAYGYDDTTHAPSGTGYAIPSNTALRVAHELLLNDAARSQPDLSVLDVPAQ